MIAGDPDDVRARLRAHGAVLVTVSTGSMAPTLRPGDSVLVRGPASSPSAGDVALLASGKLLTLHRLIGRVGLGRYARWVHAGDAPGAAAGLCRPEELLALAELPRELPATPARARLHAIALARALFAKLARPLSLLALFSSLRPVRGASPRATSSPSAKLSLFVFLSLFLIFIGCKPKVVPAPPPPRIVEVRVVDRTPAEEGSALDTHALEARAAKVIAETSGLPVADGGVAGAVAFKLRVELRVQPGEDEKHKRMMRALVTVKLSPQEGAGLLAYDQTAVAERELDAKGDGGVAGAAQALAERAMSDVVRGVGARVKLASADVAALGTALDGADDELRLEALRVAGERRERAVVPAVVRLLKSEDRDVRDRAVGTLASIRDPRAVKPPTGVARSRDLGDLPMVLDALAAIGGDEARAYLEFVASGHDNLEIRELAKKALSHLK